MKKQLSKMLLLLELSIFGVLFSSESDLKISGYMFGDYFLVLKNHNESLEGKNGFQFRRIYLTFDRNLNEKFSTRLRLEMTSSGDFESAQKMEANVKDAYLKWKIKRANLIIGVSPSPTIELIDKTWGYRSIEKTPLDLQRFGNSRDFGIALKGKFDCNGKLTYHLMWGNGNANRSESNKGKKTMAALAFFPTKDLIIEFYYDYLAADASTNWSTMQAFIAYKTDFFRFGFQYAKQKRKFCTSYEKLYSLASFFMVTKISAKLNGFLRIDRLFQPNPEGDRISYLPFATNSKAVLFIAGFDFSPIPSVKFMPNVEIIKYDKKNSDFSSDIDLMPRLTAFFRL